MSGLPHIGYGVYVYSNHKMSAFDLPSEVRVDVPPHAVLVANLVRVAGFPPISFLFLDTGRSSFMSSITFSSSFPHFRPKGEFLMLT